MVNAAELNKKMGMSQSGGIKHNYVQGIKKELELANNNTITISNENKRQRLDDSCAAEKMFDIVGLGYPYEYLVDERVTTSPLTGYTLDKPSGSLVLVHIVVAVSWARS